MTAILHLPLHLQPGIHRFIDQGIRPGHFLSAILENDLALACRLAHPDVRSRIWDIVAYIDQEAPAGAWGNAQRVERWIQEKRKHRLEAEAIERREGGPALSKKERAS